MNTEINPFDILSGKVVQNEHGTFWFKEPGVNVYEDGYPMVRRLHRENDLPAALWKNQTKSWYRNGESHRENGPAELIFGRIPSFCLFDVSYTKKEYEAKLNDYKQRNKPI